MRVYLKSLVGRSGVALAFAVTLSAASDLRLIDAVKKGNTAAVRSLLKERADVNAPQGDGATALHWAAHLNDVATADLLIRAGARANAADDTGVTPLYLACTNRNAPMVERLLAADANPNATLLNGETVLMKCAQTGDAGAVKALLSHGAKVDAREPSHDQTALMWAVAERHPGVVKVLIEAGANVRARSRTYAQTVTSEVTQRSGREELNYTVLRGGSTPLLFASRVGDVESTTLLLAAGADVRDALPDGASALVVAAHSGHGAVASLLLDSGADANDAAVGYTALHAAVLRSDLNLVKALLARGANPNAPVTKGTPVRRNSQDFELPAALMGATPYLLAAKFLEVDIMRLLLASGADPRSKMNDGTTALMAAAGHGMVGRTDRPTDRRGLAVLDGGKLEDEGRVLQAVTLALEVGGEVNAVNQAGDTAFHSAVPLGYNSVIQLLADHGGQLNVKNKRGQTPLAALRRRDQAAGAADASGQNAPKGTVDLLHKLGAVE